MKRTHLVTQEEKEHPSYTYGKQPKYATVCGRAVHKSKAMTDIARVNCLYCRHVRLGEKVRQES